MSMQPKHFLHWRRPCSTHMFWHSRISLLLLLLKQMHVTLHWCDADAERPPIAYMRKSLDTLNSKLLICEKEFLVVFMADDKWRQYLQCGPFQILTYHKSLCCLEDQLLTTDLQCRAISKQAGLQFQIKYEHVVENVAMDSLSRVGHLALLTKATVNLYCH